MTVRVLSDLPQCEVTKVHMSHEPDELGLQQADVVIILQRVEGETPVSLLGLKVSVCLSPSQSLYPSLSLLICLSRSLNWSVTSSQSVLVSRLSVCLSPSPSPSQSLSVFSLFPSFSGEPFRQISLF